MLLADLGSEPNEASSRSSEKVIATLRDYERLPDTGYTAALTARANAEEAAIDTYFHTKPDANSCFPLMGRNVVKAARAWDDEPPDNTHGVRISPLRLAVADLSEGLKSDKGDTACYPAAIADLQALESATPGEVKDASTPWPTTPSLSNGDLDGDRIFYLNDFFLNDFSTQSDTNNVFAVLSAPGP
jgi:hypothetical protein